MKDTKEALEWIVDILRKNKIPFEITGGLASRIYGSKRLLADIDIEVSDNSIPKIKQLTQKYIIYGPRQYRDKNFDLPLMTLKYKGQNIDICGKDSEKIFDKTAGKWIKEKTNLSNVKIKKVGDLIVPVVPVKDLISYKQELGRKVDKEDIIYLSKKYNKTRLVGLFYFAIGAFLVFNFGFRITGAVIGTPNKSSFFGLILGLIIVSLSALIFASRKGLESLSGELKTEYKNSHPIILDTNYLINACRDNKTYEKLVDFLNSGDRYDKTVIVPKGVEQELRRDCTNKLDLERLDNLKQFLAKYGTTIEDRRGNYWQEYKKNKNVPNIANDILKKTPKYLAYTYLSQVDKGGDADIDKFLRRTRNVSGAFTEEEYKSELEKANSLYRRAKNKGEIRKLMNGYNISPTDLEILSTAIYLEEIPDVFFDYPLDNVSIISEDSHLIDSSKIFERINPGKKGKIKVLKELPKN
jgi:gas vesicle protein